MGERSLAREQTKPTNALRPETLGVEMGVCPMMSMLELQLQYAGMNMVSTLGPLQLLYPMLLAYSFRDHCLT